MWKQFVIFALLQVAVLNTPVISLSTQALTERSTAATSLPSDTVIEDILTSNKTNITTMNAITTTSTPEETMTPNASSTSSATISTTGNTSTLGTENNTKVNIVLHKSPADDDEEHEPKKELLVARSIEDRSAEKESETSDRDAYKFYTNGTISEKIDGTRAKEEMRTWFLLFILHVSCFISKGLYDFFEKWIKIAVCLLANVVNINWKWIKNCFMECLFLRFWENFKATTTKIFCKCITGFVWKSIKLIPHILTKTTKFCKVTKIDEFLFASLILLMVGKAHAQEMKSQDVSCLRITHYKVGTDLELECVCRCKNECKGNKQWTGGPNKTTLALNNHVSEGMEDNIQIQKQNLSHYSIIVKHATPDDLNSNYTCNFGTLSKPISLDGYKQSTQASPTISTVTSTHGQDDRNNGGLRAGEIVGVVIAVFAFVFILIITGCIIRWKCKQQKPEKPNTEEPEVKKGLTVQNT